MMKKDNIIGVLTAPRQLEAQAERLRMEYERLSDMATSIGGGSHRARVNGEVYEMDRVMGSPLVTDPMAEKVVAAADIRKEYDEAVRQLEQASIKACKLIDQLEKCQGDVLYWYYVRGKSMTKVAEKLFLSKSKVHKDIQKAMDNLVRISNKSKQE